MTIFYFTGTGNSLFAARKIADAKGARKKGSLRNARHKRLLKPPMIIKTFTTVN